MVEIAPDGLIFATPTEIGLIVKTIERINYKSQLIPINPTDNITFRS